MTFNGGKDGMIFPPYPEHIAPAEFPYGPDEGLARPLVLLLHVDENGAGQDDVETKRAVSLLQDDPSRLITRRSKYGNLIRYFCTYIQYAPFPLDGDRATLSLRLNICV